MVVWCGLCKHLADANKAIQLLPCLHTLCIGCLQTVNAKKAKVCPIQHCMSPLTTLPEVKFNSCENALCSRKAAPAGEMFTAVCAHSLCTSCVDFAKRTDAPVCPVVDCGSALIEIDETEPCGGECKLQLDPSILKTLPCCQLRICVPCIDKWTEGKGICPLGKCQPVEKRSSKKKKSAGAKNLKKLYEANQNLIYFYETSSIPVLSNFPSDGECEHAVCMNCLSKTLDECEKINKPPICPADICRVTYHCDSVLALRELFPKRLAYFNRFDLSSQFSGEMYRDDQVLTLGSFKLAKYFQKASPVTMRVTYCEDEENVNEFEYDLNGTLGDFLNEIRRVLKILPFDRVYGYHRRDGDAEKSLDVSQPNMNTTLTKLKIDQDTLILVNLTGVVSNKQ